MDLWPAESSMTWRREASSRTLSSTTTSRSTVCPDKPLGELKITNKSQPVLLLKLPNKAPEFRIETGIPRRRIECHDPSSFLQPWTLCDGNRAANGTLAKDGLFFGVAKQSMRLRPNASLQEHRVIVKLDIPDDRSGLLVWQL